MTITVPIARPLLRVAAARRMTPVAGSARARRDEGVRHTCGNRSFSEIVVLAGQTFPH
jgi:hypothetical protein